MNTFVEKRGLKSRHKQIPNLTVARLRCAGDRGRGASTLPAELDVASEVVYVGGGVLVTLNTEGGGGLCVGHDELNLAEDTGGREVGLAHVAELASTRTVDGGGVAGAAVGGSGTVGTAAITRPESRGENTSGGVQGVDATRVGEGGDGNKVTRVRGDLLEKGGDGGHLILYQDRRK